MTSPSPVIPAGTWPPTTHQHAQDRVGQLSTTPPPHVHGPTDLATTGTRNGTRFLRDDFVWATPPTGTGTTTTGRTDLYPEDFGYAVANTAAANQISMQNFVNGITAGKVGVIRAGLLYQHNALLTVPTASQGGRLIVDGELQATVPTSSGLKIQASGFHVEGSGKVTAANVTTRGSTLSHQKISIDFADGVTIDGITVDGSHATGFFAYRASNYLVRDVTVKNTKADAFHNTNGSSGGRFRGTTARDVGDDTMAVVSYTGDGVVCSDIDIQGHRAFNGSARGLAVVGGTDIRYADCQVHRCSAAGVYITSESTANGDGFNTYGCTNVRMMNLFISGANYSGTDHGAAMFVSSNASSPLTKCSIDFMVADKLVRDAGTYPSGWLRHIANVSATASEISFNNIHLRGEGPATNVQGNMTATFYEATNITRQATW